MDLGVQGLDAAIEHLWKAGEVADVHYAQAALAQGARRSAGGDQFHSKARQHLGKLHQTGFVRHAEQGTPNPYISTCSWAHSVSPLYEGSRALQEAQVGRE